MKCEILAGWYQYIHWGIPCSSWSSLARLSGGTRFQSNPAGDGSRPKEAEANAMADFMCEMCLLLHKQGSDFTIQNPLGSMLWRYVAVVELCRITSSSHVHVHQCAYDLRHPGAKVSEYVSKSATFVTNFSELEKLAAHCPGVSAHHVHQHAMGTAVHDGKRFS